jgi:RNA polymerase sigma-70 factor, ECF subfamily
MTESKLLEAGDGTAYADLVEPHRGALHAHCYRMLGSVHDAEDAVQETLVRAWRSLPSFQGRSSLRSWLYTIATNVCLRAIERRPVRVLPIGHGPPADPHRPLAEPLAESTWIEPYPDERLGLGDGLAGPEARYEQRESVELAFVAALQHLPARQRAVLILRDARLREIVDRYVQAWERNDVGAIVAMLTESVTIAMPPTPTWYGGRATVAAFLETWPLDGGLRWRLTPTRANGQLAVLAHLWDPAGGGFQPHHTAVLTLAGGLIEEINTFLEPWARTPGACAPRPWVTRA